MYKGRILFVAASVSGLIGLLLLISWWPRESVSEQMLLASLYSYPANQNSNQEYLSNYRSAWLSFIDKTTMKNDGSMIPPGGQTFSKAIEDAHSEAWNLIHRLEKLPVEQRKNAFLLLQTSARRELAPLREE